MTTTPLKIALSASGTIVEQKIYLLSQTKNTSSGAYQKAIVVASNEYEALLMHPAHTYNKPIVWSREDRMWLINNDGELLSTFTLDADWVESEDVFIELIGQSYLAESQVLLSAMIP